MNLDFSKGLLPVVIQDNFTQKVLMVGYMNKEAFLKTTRENRVTFFSRSKNRLWTKGETSGNFLNVVSIATDCDNDTLLIKVIPHGPVCHTGSISCFKYNDGNKGFMYRLEQVIINNIAENKPDSYTVLMYNKGINKIAQKVGEEAVELIIEAKDDNRTLFKNEAADLLYHMLLLFRAKNIKLEDIEDVLAARNK